MKSWIEAARLRTLPLAASCILTGSALALHEDKFDFIIALLALLTTFLLQILSNFANDYGDFSHGVDNEMRVGPKRTMQSGAITKKEMKTALVVCSVLAFLCGLFLLWYSFAGDGLFLQAVLFLALGVASIAAAFKYTMGKNPYGYRGLGDLFVFLFFGIVGVCGSYFLHAKYWNTWTLLPASAVGLLSTAVLNLNNLRDYVNDEASGKRTMVVMLGFKKGKIYQALIIASAVLSIIFWMIKFNDRAWQWLPLLPLVLPVVLQLKLFKTNDPATLDGDLKRMALSAFLFSFLFIIVQFFA